MSYINMKNSINLNFLPVSNIFIEKYITKAKSVFVCIYIYSLKKCIEGQALTLKNIATDFDILESDVLNAWKFWKDEGVVDFTEKDGEFFVEFFDIAVSHNSIAENSFLSFGKDAEKTAVTHRERGRIPDYSIEELNVYGENKEIKELFKIAEGAFGSMLDYSKMKLVFSLYDWLNMPVDVIEFLIKYCVKNGKGRNLRYIETVAVDWSERGIDSVEKAKELVKVFNNEYREIMKAFGISVIVPVEGQVKFMEDWIKKLPLELIKEACRRTVIKTGKPAFEYADSIIQKWYKQGAKNISDVEKIDFEFSQTKSENKLNDTKKNAGKTNNFVNYEQRKWDFAALNKLKGELLDNGNAD